MRAAALLLGLAWFAAPLCAAAQSTPGPSPAAGAPASPDASASPLSVDPAVTTRAKEWYHRIQTANFDRSQLTADASALLTDSLVKGVAAKIAPLGDPTAFEIVDEKTEAPNTAYIYKLTFASGTLYFVFVLNDSGKISGLYLKPG
jgi:hypothetical protein